MSDLKSRAFNIRDQVWMQLASTPQGGPFQECYFDSIEVAEEFALRLWDACIEARKYRIKCMKEVLGGGQ